MTFLFTPNQAARLLKRFARSGDSWGGAGHEAVARSAHGGFSLPEFSGGGLVRESQLDYLIDVLRRSAVLLSFLAGGVMTASVLWFTVRAAFLTPLYFRIRSISRDASSRTVLRCCRRFGGLLVLLDAYGREIVSHPDGKALGERDIATRRDSRFDHH